MLPFDSAINQLTAADYRRPSQRTVTDGRLRTSLQVCGIWGEEDRHYQPPAVFLHGFGHCTAHNQALAAESAQIVGSLPRGIGPFQQAADERHQVAVTEARHQMAKGEYGGQDSHYLRIPKNNALG